MRAKTVPTKAYIFDFDDTLVKTTAKTHVYRDGRRIYSMTPEEFNNYEPQPGDDLDTSDFTDPRIIMAGTKFKMWPALENISNAKKMGRSTSDIYILTARSKAAQMAIHNFLEREGIEIPLENVITVGTDKNRENHDIAKEKEKSLKKLKKKYAELIFFDDSEKNIELASKVGGIKTRLVDNLKIK